MMESLLDRPYVTTRQDGVVVLQQIATRCRNNLMLRITALLLLCVATQTQAEVSFRGLTEKVFQVTSDESSVKAIVVKDGDKVILIDTMTKTLGQGIADHIADHKLDLKYIINTHYHGDHVGGNVHYQDAVIIAHEMTHQNILDDKPYGPPDSFSRRALPNLLFQEQLRILLNDIVLEIAFLGTAHTRGDAVIFIPSENVICIGDIMLDANNTLPYTTDPQSMIGVLTRIRDRIDHDTKIVTGHGQIASKHDLMALIDIIEQTTRYVQQGGDISNFPQQWQQWDSQFLTMERWLAQLDELFNQ